MQKIYGFVFLEILAPELIFSGHKMARKPIFPWRSVWSEKLYQHKETPPWRQWIFFFF